MNGRFRFVQLWVSHRAFPIPGEHAPQSANGMLPILACNGKQNRLILTLSGSL